jgi:hypothetical protein
LIAVVYATDIQDRDGAKLIDWFQENMDIPLETVARDTRKSFMYCLVAESLSAPLFGWEATSG